MLKDNLPAEQIVRFTGLTTHRPVTLPEVSEEQIETT
jgi:hypothetical protein